MNENIRANDIQEDSQLRKIEDLLMSCYENHNNLSSLNVELPPEKLLSDNKTIKLLNLDKDVAPDKSNYDREKVKFNALDCGICLDCSRRTGQEWLFTLYDFDGQGKVTKEDISTLLKAFYDALGTSLRLPVNRRKSVKLRLSVGTDETSSEILNNDDLVGVKAVKHLQSKSQQKLNKINNLSESPKKELVEKVNVDKQINGHRILDEALEKGEENNGALKDVENGNQNDQHKSQSKKLNCCRRKTKTNITSSVKTKENVTSEIKNKHGPCPSCSSGVRFQYDSPTSNAAFVNNSRSCQTSITNPTGLSFQRICLNDSCQYSVFRSHDSSRVKVNPDTSGVLKPRSLTVVENCLKPSRNDNECTNAADEKEKRNSSAENRKAYNVRHLIKADSLQNTVSFSVVDDTKHKQCCFERSKVFSKSTAQPRRVKSHRVVPPRPASIASDRATDGSASHHKLHRHRDLYCATTTKRVSDWLERECSRDWCLRHHEHRHVHEHHHHHYYHHYYHVT